MKTWNQVELDNITQLHTCNIETMPMAKESLIVATLDDEILIFDPDSNEAHLLDNISAFVFALCDGETAIKDMAVKLKEKEPSCENPRDIVWIVIEELQEKGLLQHTPRISKRFTRRDFLRRTAKTAAALPVIVTLSAPSPAAAVSFFGMFSASPATNPARACQGFNTEAYDYIEESPFYSAVDKPLSTFSIDVDTASYSNVRRFLNNGQLPPPDAVRIEELINYFNYEYREPTDDLPFSLNIEISECPWKPGHHLLLAGIQGRRIPNDSSLARNLVFLIDVSGSMKAANKLLLLKRSMRLLIETLGEKDSVSIVVYAGASGLSLPPTSGDKKEQILAAIDELESGGSTNGGAGIRLAYKAAMKHFIPGGINRVILATDGDFNVGTTSRGELVRLIEKKRKSGVFLTVLGFGAGNLKDSTMEILSNRGNGNYAYIDSLSEARKVLVKEAAGTLITIAKDVKLQLEFNPNHVHKYRLIGYENRLLQDRDFSDDGKDAGEIGSGHRVTALYELVMQSDSKDNPSPTLLRYQTGRGRNLQANNDELLFLKVRYKEPELMKSTLIQKAIYRDSMRGRIKEASDNFRFASSVACFGMLLRNSKYKSNSNYGMVLDHAMSALGEDREGYRAQFLNLVKKAEMISYTFEA